MADPEHVASARAVYDMAASSYVDFVGTEISTATEDPVDRSMLAAFVELLEAGPGGEVADIGCGPGRVAGFLAHHGLSVVGTDVSEGMLAAARRAHPEIRFALGQLSALPFDSAALAGAVSWYSIIYTPPNHLGEAFTELERVIAPGGRVLLGFQAGSGEPVHRADAHGTGLPLTTYLHDPSEVARQLKAAGFENYAQILREPQLDHETTLQALVLAHKPAR